MERTRTKIIQAALAQIEQAGLHVTTKQIAEAAGVNELTLFRHFGNKQQLITVALAQMIGSISSAQYMPSGSLQQDLADIVEQYAQLVDQHPGILVQVLGTADAALQRDVVMPLQRQIAQSLIQTMEYYKQRGELADVSVQDLVRELMGPLLARAFLRNAIAARPLDIEAYVRRFIRGHAATNEKAIL